MPPVHILPQESAARVGVGGGRPAPGRRARSGGRGRPPQARRPLRGSGLPRTAATRAPRE